MFEKGSVGTFGHSSRQFDLPQVQFLQAMFQHRPVFLVKHVTPDLDGELIGMDANDVAVVSGVVELAFRRVMNRA